MHRFYLTPEQCSGVVLTLPEREAHHASAVLRIRHGDVVSVLDGVGSEYVCQVLEVQKRQILLRVDGKKTTPSPFCSVTLVQAVPKGRMMDFIIQKATELGVNRIVPILTERVNVLLDEGGAEQKQEKWQLTAIEAIKQCGQSWLPKVEAPLTIKSFLARKEKPELAFACSLQEGARHPREHFDSFFHAHKRSPTSISLWVGPEGDFSSEEMSLIQASGVLPVTLGSLVLRCETAALYALSVTGYELQFRHRNG